MCTSAKTLSDLKSLVAESQMYKGGIVHSIILVTEPRTDTEIYTTCMPTSLVVPVHKLAKYVPSSHSSLHFRHVKSSYPVPEHTPDRCSPAEHCVLQGAQITPGVKTPSTIQRLTMYSPRLHWLLHCIHSKSRVATDPLQKGRASPGLEHPVLVQSLHWLSAVEKSPSHSGRYWWSAHPPTVHRIQGASLSEVPSHCSL
jgi:hypothetical protein